MKFSTLLILLPFASVALAAPYASTSCLNTYCNVLFNEGVDCFRQYSDGTLSNPGSQQLRCLCTGKNRSLGDKYGYLPLELLRLN